MKRVAAILLLVLPLTLAITFKGKTHLRLRRDGPGAWGYNDQGGDWSGDCAIGHEQSPIAINSHNAVCDAELQFHLNFPAHGLETEVDDKGYTLEVEGHHTTLKATTVNHVPFEYQAAQFHFHAPSEHIVDGKRYDLEMHLVHKFAGDSAQARNRTIAVVGFLFEVDDNARPNPLIEKLDLEHIGHEFELDLDHLLEPQVGRNPAYYAYEGSLTTPPCSELVNWFVIRKPLKITSEQLRPFLERYSRNQEFAHGNGDNRELQELNGRVIKLGNARCGETC